MTALRSRLYEGWLQHRRHRPRPHQFRYRVFMPYLCLDELPLLFDASPLWSFEGRGPANFRRADFLGDPAVPLAQAVRQRVHEATGQHPEGPIYLLANLRYFGFSMNPIACYYCFNRDESQLDWIVAEVTNTPWKERHSYVLEGPEPARQWLRRDFSKAFHVSPFQPMNMHYHWRSNTPADSLRLHLANSADGERVFDACLSLSARPWTRANLHRALLRYPAMTAQVGLGIYWQALKLYAKGMPLYSHPDKSLSGARND
ncbi:DUF1365 domain-containing protein [Parahaliea mediterranea]|uniref:DUF1365 domain-containing protein n=1 Tax=Parahaliea mediterranea TaxID=651086 RepID=UPI001F4D39EA|nr:DUF1365 domain-containing protein [Parahaliea mediterranea]